MLFPDVYQTVQESAISEDDSLAFDVSTHHGFDPFHLVAINEQAQHSILPKIDIGCLLQHAAPFSRKHHLVALASGTPHGRTFRLVEHPELDHGAVGNDARITTHRIDFADDLTLGNTAHSGVARHGGKQPQVHCDE